jgi:hypothetical protein
MKVLKLTSIINTHLKQRKKKSYRILIDQDKNNCFENKFLSTQKE